MSTSDFAHLHVASGYSMRHGASTPAALVARAAEAGMTTVALTDRNGTYGAVRFVRACQEAGLGAVLGVDLAIRGDRMPGTSAHGPSVPEVSRATPRRRTPVRGGSFVDQHDPRVVILARGKAGWRALCRLVSAAHAQALEAGERGQPFLTRSRIAQVLLDHDVPPGALVLLLGPDSDVGQAVGERRGDRARSALQQWQAALPDQDVQIEVVSHRADPSHPRGMARSTVLAARMLRFAVDHHVMPVLTNAVRCAEPMQMRTLDVLDAARRLVPLDLRHLDRTNGEGFLKTPEQMAAIAYEIAQAAQVGDPASIARRLLAVTVDTARSCRIDPRHDLGLGIPHLPDPDASSGGAAATAADIDRLLRQRCESGITRTGIRDDAALRVRLDAELSVVAGLGFGSYFLTVADIVALIRSKGVRVAARGSGAGSLINHLLGVSGVDPMQQGLLFERFLSPLRGALPDIDLDVESDRRTEMYTAILDRFGVERCACVSMVETYRVRHAIRDVGAALGMAPAEIGAIATSFPHIRARDARAALRELPELRRSGLARDEQRLDVLFELVESLDALPRGVALHPCGIVLSDRSLLDRTPVETSAQGFPMSQFDKDDVEHLGLLKLDVLGIRMQSAMAHAVDEIVRVGGPAIDLDDRQQVPLDDPAAFALIRSTRTLGCFQIESPGQRELLGRFAPEEFADLIIDISLFRPGPVKSDMITPFLRARQGWSQPQYLHPDLEPILTQTCGVVVFHEQVLRIVALFAGCSLAQADEVRRALGDREQHEELRAWFYPAALARGYDLAVIEQVWDVLVAFGSFGFCKAHAAAFALPTYQSAWLKQHHPAAFLAGVLTHDPGMYPKRLILDDARHFGVAVLPLDINRSDGVHRIEPVEREPVECQPVETGETDSGEAAGGFGIRLSLAEVKGIASDEIDRIMRGRPYCDLADFVRRARVSRPVVERLIVAGALDAVAGIGSGRPGVHRRGRLTRRDLLLQAAELDRLHRSGDRRRSTTGQLTLAMPDLETPEIPGLPEMTDTERVRAELDVLGMEVGRHVIDFYAPLLESLGVTRSRDLLGRRSKSELLVAGVKVATQTPPVRSGRRVVFLTLDDGSGPVDLAFFDDVQGEATAAVFGGWLLLARGELRRTGPKGVSLRATGAWDLTMVQRLAEVEGIEAAARLIEHTPRPGGRGGSTAPSPHRVLVHPSGFTQSPYADIKPQGVEVSDTRRALPTRQLWHTSPGTPGAGA